MPKIEIEPAEFYRREAERLQQMAAKSEYGDVRDGLMEIARRYEAMGRQRGNVVNFKSA